MQGLRLTFGCTMDLHVPLLYRSPMPIHAYFGQRNHFVTSNCCTLLDEYRYISGVYAPHDWDDPPELQAFLPTLRDAVFFGAAMPIRVVFFLSTLRYHTWAELHALPLTHTIVGHGQPRSSPHEMMLVVVQNATAVDTCMAYEPGSLHRAPAPHPDENAYAPHDLASSPQLDTHPRHV